MIGLGRIYIFLILAGVLFGSAAVAVVKKSVLPSDRLEYLTVEVNGTPVRVSSGQELVVVEGDQLRLLDPVLRDPSKKVESVNWIGYRSKSGRSNDDRGQVLHTERDLIKKWALGPDKNRYKVKIGSAKTRHGEVWLKVIRPELEYLKVKINESFRLLRDGEVLRVSALDDFKIVEAQTNISDQNERVSVQIMPVEETGKIQSLKFYNIQLLLAGRVFAKIPMQVESP